MGAMHCLGWIEGPGLGTVGHADTQARGLLQH
jgi:hypothetical protein